MDHFKPSSQFELTTNNAEAFKFLLYSDDIQLETKPVKQQRAILLHNIGDDALNIYKTFGLQETLTNPTITEILEKFDNHFKPFKNACGKCASKHEYDNCPAYGVGLLKNKQSIIIKEDAILQVYTARRLPLALREPVREELEKNELQRLVLQLQHYDFDLKYIPGKKLYTADALSRDYIANDLFTTPEIEISQNNQVLMVTYSNNRHQDLVEATNNDPVLQEVKNYIENGWPIHKKTMNPFVKPFWDIKEELFEWVGLLCRGVKLVISKKRRNHILSLLHNAHRGINSTLSLARSTFYWPGMCQEVEEFVKKCRICQKYSRNNTKEPLIPHETGNYPFQKIGVDLFEIEGRKYLGIVDYYIKYPEVFELRSTKAEMVIEKLKEVFARCGVPEIMMADNGPPFQSTEMMEFAKEWNVTHTTSSPRFPQSNGMIERTMQTLKSTIIKCQQSKQDIYQALLLLRNTEHNSLPSPANMLYGRKQRLFLPMKTTLMNESRICEDSIRKQHEANQSRMKFYFNRHARDLPSLENGQSVLVRQEKQWSPAKVIAPGVHPRSYLLEDTKGSVLRRNRRDLRPAGTLSGPTEKESPPEKQEQLDPQPSTSSQSEETSATTRTRCGRLVKPPSVVNSRHHVQDDTSTLINTPLEKLNDQNYRSWKYNTKMILIERELWKYVTEPAPDEEASRAIFNMKQEKALAMIALTISPSQQIHIMDCTTAREAWDTLEQVYEPKSRSRILQLKKQFISIRFEEQETMTNYLGRLKICSDHLREAGAEMQDQDLAYSMLTGLPESYDGIIMGFSNVEDKEFTSSTVKHVLLAEYERRMARRVNNTNEAMQFGTTTRKEDKKKKNFTSYKCGKEGHIARSCRGKAIIPAPNF
ncbi:hypothetical protein LAZ67_X003058 [Cordylochernes scorpioides]|uniref:RNA-directed DNA polymerase n=1 Tax=Cordylochernes scorpioides TaxID=51811 RepID=A0ABY6LTU7_9ARAC|nr:hypothetical protein LAZ67_X003058 [Cordylochernes scorpioides]